MRSSEASGRIVCRLMQWALSLSILLTVGCAHMQLPTYPTGNDSTSRLLQGSGEIAVEPFTAAPGTKDRGLSVRGSPLDGAADGRFSTYVREALIAELDTAHRLDPAAPVRISGVLTRNELDGAGMRKGEARVGVRFTVSRNGQTVYAKDIDVSHEWDSSFIGMIAIPAAVQNYVTTVQKLLARLTADEDFIRATASPPDPSP